MEEELKSAGVRFKFIASGKGAHRYVDIIPEAAGKLPALECALAFGSAYVDEDEVPGVFPCCWPCVSTFMLATEEGLVLLGLR